jgi:tRNA pseudouridine55 synthase
VERPPRPITIYELELLDQVSPTEYTLRVLCSKGTYVRTLCHDIGAALGCGGTLSALRRTRSAGFTLADAVTLDQIQAGDPASFLRPVEAYFAHHPVLTLPSKTAEKKVRNGSPLAYDGPDGTYRVHSPQG